MKSEIKIILEELKKSLFELYENHLTDLVLYGSYARGEEKEGSDLDVLMVLDDYATPYSEIRKTGEICSSLSLKYNLSISLIPMRKNDWSQRNSLFLWNIRHEGVPV
jgi:uncharacterized protein